MSTDDKRHILGRLGEEIAAELLIQEEYKEVTDLNDLCPNAPYADIYAEGEKGNLIISVKTRMRFGKNRKENHAYNLTFGGGDERAKKTEKIYCAKAYWMTVMIDDKEWKYSVYFGSLEELEGSKSISIPKCRNGDIGQCFVKEESFPQEWKIKM